MVTRKGDENGDGAGAVGCVHPLEGWVVAGQGKADAGGCTWGICWSLEGRQADASRHPHFVSACSVLSRGSCDHFQVFLKVFV